MAPAGLGNGQRARQLNLAAAGQPAPDQNADPHPAATYSNRVPRAAEAAGQLVNPYKGLRAFHETDAADFFGRAALTEQLLARLVEGGDSVRFLAVVGPSGSGKSSVVRAGLVPALRRGALPNSDRLFITDMVRGTRPLEELELALLRVSVGPMPGLLSQLSAAAAVLRTLPGGSCRRRRTSSYSC